MLVPVFNKIGLIYAFISITPLILDLEHITLSPSRIPFPILGHIILKGVVAVSMSFSCNFEYAGG